MTYEQAYKDHCYLWNTYGSAYDMTGGYGDQRDLTILLKKPSKRTAKECLVHQIHYWFQVGIDYNDYIHSDSNLTMSSLSHGSSGIPQEAIDDPKVQEIAERHYIDEFYFPVCV